MRTPKPRARLEGEEVEIVEILWTAVVFGFTAGVLGLVGYALVRVATMGRREQH